MMQRQIEIQRQLRYIIVDDDTGEILDDAKSFGYKSEYSANKVMWYKFQGGSDKIEEQKLESNNFFKNHPEIRKFILDYYNENFSEDMLGELAYDSIIKEVIKVYNVIIPRYYLKYLYFPYLIFPFL